MNTNCNVFFRFPYFFLLAVVLCSPELITSGQVSVRPRVHKISQMYLPRWSQWASALQLCSVAGAHFNSGCLPIALHLSYETGQTCAWSSSVCLIRGLRWGFYLSASSHLSPILTACSTVFFPSELELLSSSSAVIWKQRKRTKSMIADECLTRTMTSKLSCAL